MELLSWTWKLRVLSPYLALCMSSDWLFLSYVFLLYNKLVM